MAPGGHLEYAIKEAPGDPNAILGRKIEQRKKSSKSIVLYLALRRQIPSV